MSTTKFKNNVHITGNLQVDGSVDAAEAGAAQLLTATAAVAAPTRYLSLSHATVVIAATMVATDHRGLFIVGNTSASGTAAHTVTLTGGTWNGTATIITLNAPGETIGVFFDESGVGTVLFNIGAVALS